MASGDNPISYSNLKYQLEDGRDTGYNDRELMSGVIRAIKPNSNLRQYFESEGRMPFEEFLQHIKNHYKLTDSSIMLTQLSGSVQAVNQKVQDYVAQLGRLRNDIVTVSREEGNPLDPDMVRKRFLHALSVGVQKDTIRLEIQAWLKNTAITDRELGAEVQKIAAREEEHEAKMEEEKAASTNALHASDGNAKVMAELARISAKVSEVSVSKLEVGALKEQMAGLENKVASLGGTDRSWHNQGGQGHGGQRGNDGAVYYYNDSSNQGYGYDTAGGYNDNCNASNNCFNFDDGFNNNYWQNPGGGGNYSNNRGGYGSSRGGGHFGNRGGRNTNRGGGNSNNGNLSYRGGGNFRNGDGYGNRGGFNQNFGQDGNRGGFNGNRGGGNRLSNNVGGNGNRGSYGGNRGGFGRGGAGSSRGGHHSGGNKAPFPKCEECQKTSAFCNHCIFVGRRITSINRVQKTIKH